ncbi:hypothetical protein ACQ4PT_036765 [Festuca glaucescens]
MDMAGAEKWSSPSSPSSHPKRPAGRTKFMETRHPNPVYHGVRRRGSAGRWVCEVRVPGKRGVRLLLGTHVTAEAAARAHDAAMLTLLGGRSVSATRLNFADSAWLLAVPSALTDLSNVRRVALAAVADFQRREAAYCAATVPVDELDTSSSSAPSSSGDNAGSSATSQPFPNGLFDDVPAAAVLAATCLPSSSTCPGIWTWDRATLTSRRGCSSSRRRRNSPRCAGMAELTRRSGVTTETETPDTILNELKLLPVSMLKSEEHLTELIKLHDTHATIRAISVESNGKEQEKET